MIVNSDLLNPRTKVQRREDIGDSNSNTSSIRLLDLDHSIWELRKVGTHTNDFNFLGSIFFDTDFALGRHGTGALIRLGVARWQWKWAWRIELVVVELRSIVFVENITVHDDTSIVSRQEEVQVSMRDKDTSWELATTFGTAIHNSTHLDQVGTIKVPKDALGDDGAEFVVC